MKILFAGGGTGGHIYPAVAVAQVLKQKGFLISFVGTRKGLETKIIPKEGFPLYFVSVGALNNVGVLTKILTLLALPVALIQSVFILIRLRPKVVLGVGGYSSGPVLVAAKLLGFPTAIFESNAHPGLTNRILGQFVKTSFTNFSITNTYLKHAVKTGMPIRQEFSPLKLASGKKLRILIFGGSQGARGINNSVLEAVKRGGTWLSNVEIVHQIGRLDFQKLSSEYKTLNLPQLEFHEFLYDMPKRYAWADVVFCRAGASTLAELAACQKASVLIPFPAAADDHQMKNAQVLAKAGAALLVEQKDFTPGKFVNLISEFILDPTKLKALEGQVGQFFTPQSAELMASKLAEMTQ